MARLVKMLRLQFGESFKVVSQVGAMVDVIGLAAILEIRSKTNRGFEVPLDSFQAGSRIAALQTKVFVRELCSSAARPLVFLKCCTLFRYMWMGTLVTTEGRIS